MIDWRVRGLMPPLASQTTEWGSGHLYFWREDNIVDRAKTVYDVLAKHRDAGAALISICLMGFEVDPRKLHHAWVVRLGKESSKYAELVARRGEEDRAASTAEGLAKRLGVNWEYASKLVAELTALVFQEQPDPTSAEEVFKNLSRAFAEKWTGQSHLVTAITGERVALVLDGFLSIGTNAAGMKAFSQPSSDIERAHFQWLTIWHAILRFLPEVREPREGLNERRFVASIFGGFVVTALILGKARGYDKQIERSINLLEEASHKQALRSLFRSPAEEIRVEEVRDVVIKFLTEIGLIWDLPDLVALFREPATLNEGA